MRHVYSTRYQKFLDSLKQARLEANLSQVEVAGKLEKPQSYVSKCESGERRVDLIELVAFAEIYHKPIEYFIPKNE